MNRTGMVAVGMQKSGHIGICFVVRSSSVRTCRWICEWERAESRIIPRFLFIINYISTVTIIFHSTIFSESLLNAILCPRCWDTEVGKTTSLLSLD